MCLGNMQTSNQTTNTTTPPSWLTGAAQGNLGYAQTLQQSGFTPYTGSQVANFAPQQQVSFQAGQGLYDSVTGGPIGSTLSNVMNASPQTVSPSTIASQMSPYMNQYVGSALAPQVSNLNNQLSLQSQLTQGQATSAGAFGDPRANILQQNQNAAGSLQEQGLVGNAYTSAFNTAIGAGAQDVSNNLNAQTTNANLANTQMTNELSAANSAYNFQTGATGLLNTLGGQQTAQSQAQLNAAYNQYLMAQQYPFQTTQLMDQTLGASTAGAPMTSTSTTQSPNNAGYGILGSMFGAGLGSLPGTTTGANGSTTTSGGSGLLGLGSYMFSDKRLKENIKKVGETKDHIPVKTFNWKGDPAKRPQLGLVAQDVEKKKPEAVRTDPVTGYKKVHYPTALAPRAAKGNRPVSGLGAQLGIAA